MATIQAKRRPVIQKGVTYSYSPETFAEHKVDKFIIAETAEQLLEIIKPMEVFGSKFITFDTETHPYYKSSKEVPPNVVRRWVGQGKSAVPQDYPFCISVCDGVHAVTIFDSVDNGFKEFKKLAPLFEDQTVEKIAHNTKFDMHQFANAGLKIVGKLHDTVVMAKLVNENRPSYDLKDLAEKHPQGIVKFEYMVKAYKQMNHITDYRTIPTELLAQYANADVWNCFMVFLREYPKLKRDELLDLYNNEMELMIALYAMERYGMRADMAYERILKHELQETTDAAEKAIYDTVGYFFNINSTQQLYNALLSLGVNKDWIPITGKGNPSLDKKVLEKLAGLYNVDIVQKVLEFRKFEKLLGTYAVGIYDQIDSMHKVHGNINQTEATTGRMSVTKPALQTLPKKDTRIRRIFIPSDGYSLYFMDLDQIEYRLFAHYSQAQGLIEAIKNGHDVHRATASIIYHKPIEEINDDERQRGKTINFSLIYGQGDEALAISLKVSVDEARRIKANYFANIPEAKPFIMTVHQVIKLRGYIKNFYGRRRRLSVDDCYKAPNALIQGCAADYLKAKIVDIYKFLRYNNLNTRLLMPVHDELVIEVFNGEEKYLPNIRWLLSDFKNFRVPITAGVEKGNPSWGQKEDAENIGFEEPEDKGYLSYNVFDGHVFNI